VDFHPFILSLIAFIIATLTSQAGVSGAFLLMPVQISLLGITSPVASATNLAYNIIAIPSGIKRFRKEKRFLAPLALSIIAGSIPGAFIGAFIRTDFLLNPKPFKLFVGLVLMCLGLRLILMRKRKIHAVTEIQIKQMSFKKVTFSFAHEDFSFSPIVIFLLVLFTGTIAGAYGIGGGALLAPILISVFMLPPHAIASSTLTGTFTTSIMGVCFYYLLDYPPDWKIAIFFGIGGMLGMYTGARMQKYIPERIIKIILAFLIFIPAIKYILGYFR